MLLEVCCGHYESARLAIESGADRIELCAALPIGGLTPSSDTIVAVKKLSNVPIMVLIRPREGNFIYSKAEKKIILSEIKSTINAGADGIVIGALDTQSGIDFPFIQKITSEHPTTSITFHRAFDFVIDPFLAMEQLIDLGIERILTSGQKPTALAGKDLIQKLIKKAGDRIIIMPGSGINHHNIKEIVKLFPKEIHLSAKKTLKSKINQAFDTSLMLFDLEEFSLCKKVLATTVI